MSTEPIIFTVERNTGLEGWTVAYLEPGSDSIVTWSETNNSNTIKLFSWAIDAYEAFFAAHSDAHCVARQRLYQIQSERRDAHETALSSLQRELRFRTQREFAQRDFEK